MYQGHTNFQIVGWKFWLAWDFNIIKKHFKSPGCGVYRIILPNFYLSKSWLGYLSRLRVAMEWWQRTYFEYSCTFSMQFLYIPCNGLFWWWELHALFLSTMTKLMGETKTRITVTIITITLWRYHPAETCNKYYKLGITLNGGMITCMIEPKLWVQLEE